MTISISCTPAHGRRRATLGAMALALLALFTLSGCGPKWVVVSQGPPNAFGGAKDFAVMPIDFSGLHVGEKDEATYLAAKDDGQRAGWAKDKITMNVAFLQFLVKDAAEYGIRIVPASGPASAPFTLRPRVGMVEPGWYGGIVSSPGEARMELQVLGPNGQPIDVIALEPKGAGFTVTQRMAGTGASAAYIIAHYLKERAL